MDYKKIIITILLITIPLILLILCYRSYVYTYCQNDMKCMKDRLIFNLKNIDNKLKGTVIEENKNMNEKIKNIQLTEETSEEDVIEGFFDGLVSWFSGSSPASVSSSNLPVSPGSLGSENLGLLEKKITERMKQSSTFPPTDDLNGNSDDFKDSDNSEVLKSLGAKPLIKQPNLIKQSQPKNPPIISNQPLDLQNKSIQDNTVPSNVMSANAMSANTTSANAMPSNTTSANAMPSNTTSANAMPSNAIPSNAMPSNTAANTLVNNINNNTELQKLDLKSLFGSCQFFNDKCPQNYQPLGNFSISGIGNGNMLTCGNVEETKPAHAIAKIKNNSIYDIYITDPGKGFNPDSPPKISIEGTKGHGASAEAVIDDNGELKLIKIINPGYNYTETPNILIDAPYMNSSCHLCCKM